jgi:hypothetical protein
MVSEPVPPYKTHYTNIYKNYLIYPNNNKKSQQIHNTNNKPHSSQEMMTITPTTTSPHRYSEGFVYIVDKPNTFLETDIYRYIERVRSLLLTPRF